MNEVVAQYPKREIQVVLDNLDTPRPGRDLWFTAAHNQSAAAYEWTKAVIHRSQPK